MADERCTKCGRAPTLQLLVEANARADSAESDSAALRAELASAREQQAEDDRALMALREAIDEHLPHYEPEHEAGDYEEVVRITGKELISAQDGYHGLRAELAGVKTDLDATMRDYQIEGDESVHDICERLTATAVRLRARNLECERDRLREALAPFGRRMDIGTVNECWVPVGNEHRWAARRAYGRALAQPSPAPALKPLALKWGTGREALGEMVREEWIAWAKEQPDPKPSWLVPWDGLAEPDKEVDRRIGERLFRHGQESAQPSPATPSGDSAECGRAVTGAANRAKPQAKDDSRKKAT